MSAPPSSSLALSLTTPSPSSSLSRSASTTASTPSTTVTDATTSIQSTSSPTTSSTGSSSTSTQSSSTSTPAALSPTSATAFVTTEAGGSVVTVTTTFIGSSSVPSPQNNPTSSSNSFFSNKGAVAGVFTVVGLVVVGLIIALVINAIQRRRAEKFDRDVAEAAAEAAVARSPFDEYPYSNTGGKDGNGGGGGGGYGYSDNSHGTYQLPPLPPHNDRYGMSEMSQYDPYAAGAASLAAAAAVGRSRSRKDSEPGTPGLAGVGAGTLAREPSKRAPYHAFAGPPPQPHELQASGTLRSIRGTNQDVLEAVGLAGPSAAPSSSHHFNNSASGAFVVRKPSETTQNTHLSGRSQFGSASSGQHPMPLQPGYPVDSYYPHRNDDHSPDPFATYPPAAAMSKPLPNPHHTTLPSPPLPNRQSVDNEDLAGPVLRSEEQRMSYQDDADYSQGNRILRITNQ